MSRDRVVGRSVLLPGRRLSHGSRGIVLRLADGTGLAGVPGPAAARRRGSRPGTGRRIAAARHEAAPGRKGHKGTGWQASLPWPEAGGAGLRPARGGR